MYCSKVEPMVRTWAFMCWSLQVTNDTTIVSPLARTICLTLCRQKRCSNDILFQIGNSSKWSTNRATSFSFGFLGIRCETTTNYILEDGTVTFFEGIRPLTVLIRTKGCIPLSNDGTLSTKLEYEITTPSLKAAATDFLECIQQN